jgi:transcription-repair coupling factor (superfamily II helicase)
MDGPDKLRVKLELPDAASRLRTAKGLFSLLKSG